MKAAAAAAGRAGTLNHKPLSGAPADCVAYPLLPQVSSNVIWQRNRNCYARLLLEQVSTTRLIQNQAPLTQQQQSTAGTGATQGSCGTKQAGSVLCSWSCSCYLYRISSTQQQHTALLQHQMLLMPLSLSTHSTFLGYLMCCMMRGCMLCSYVLVAWRCLSTPCRQKAPCQPCQSTSHTGQVQQGTPQHTTAHRSTAAAATLCGRAGHLPRAQHPAVSTLRNLHGSHRSPAPTVNSTAPPSEPPSSPGAVDSCRFLSPPKVQQASTCGSLDDRQCYSSSCLFGYDQSACRPMRPLSAGAADSGVYTTSPTLRPL